MVSHWPRCCNVYHKPSRLELRRWLSVAFLLTGSTSYAIGKPEPSTSLISNAQRQLVVAESRKTDAESDLERMDRTLAEFSDRVARTREEIEHKRSQLEHMTGENTERQRAMATTRAQIAHVARAAYELGRQPVLKILLDNENPMPVTRSLAYYHYFLRGQAKQLDTLRSQITSLEPLERQTSLEQKSLTELLVLQESEKAELNRRRGQSAQLLERASTKVQNHRQLVQRLIDDQARLKQITGEIGRKAQDSNNRAAPGTPFADLKGRLEWPVEGTLLAQFGVAHPIAAQQRSHGVLFGAAHGAPVHAVWAGRVVFSDWLTGFGFMTIVDHGDGFLTLYGYNEINLKTVGENVQTHETIGRVGASGWLEGPALYFEIRFEGKPVNPSPWLASR